MTPLTIAVSGTSGAGKSTLIDGVAAALHPAAVVRFDDYETVSRYPPDMRVWLDAGADPDAFEAPAFDAAVVALRGGEAITLPSGQRVEPAPLLLLEEPFGRQRTPMHGLIDLVVLVDIPPDVALARKLLRMADFFEREQSAEAFIGHLRFFLPWYITALRESYAAINKRISADCDLILNGMLPGEVLVEQLAGWLGR